MCPARDMYSDTLAVHECVQIVIFLCALVSPGNREKLQSDEICDVNYFSFLWKILPLYPHPAMCAMFCMLSLNTLTCWPSLGKWRSDVTSHESHLIQLPFEPITAGLWWLQGMLQSSQSSGSCLTTVDPDCLENQNCLWRESLGLLESSREWQLNLNFNKTLLSRIRSLWNVCTSA